jgi:hypothetical protein
MPLAVSSALRFSLGQARRTQLSAHANLSSGFALRQSITQRTLVARPKPADSSHGLPHPFSTLRLGGPLTTGLPHPLRSALRVWSPSRRLTPSEPQPVFFRTGGAHGIHPSELSPLTRYPRVSARKDPLTVSPAVSTGAEAPSRPGRPRFLGFDPCESPWRPERD